MTKSIRTHKDVYGQPIAVGDYVAYIHQEPDIEEINVVKVVGILKGAFEHFVIVAGGKFLLKDETLPILPQHALKLPTEYAEEILARKGK